MFAGLESRRLAQCKGTENPIVNLVVPNTSYGQGYKMASSENLQLSQRNDGPEPPTVAEIVPYSTVGKNMLQDECSVTKQLFPEVEVNRGAPKLYVYCARNRKGKEKVKWQHLAIR